MQRAGAVDFEQDVEDPVGSRIFSNNPDFLGDPATRAFVCDSLRMLVIGVTSAQELDQLMELDLDVQRRAQQEPVGALHSIADALPGLGIVAAVLGVVITMQAIGGAPETVGQKVAAALVGTFLGILLCYGVGGANRLPAREAERDRTAVSASAAHRDCGVCARGLADSCGRVRAASIPVELRPSFLEMETTIRRDARIPAPTKQETPEANHAEAQPA